MKKLYRIRKNEEFSEIINTGKSVADNCFVLYFVKRNKDNCRIGISVSKKLGNAVERNRIKRQVREMLWQLVDFESCLMDYVVIVRKGFLDNDYHNNKNHLDLLIKKAII